jgi:hypothetical protein
MSFDNYPILSIRHPELVSGSISQFSSGAVGINPPRHRAVSKTSDQTARWTLKRVQGDVVVGPA